MHAGQSADDLQMAQFLCTDIHQKILSVGIVAVQTLYGVLHGSRQFSICAPELLQQHVSKARVGLADSNRIH